MTDNDVEYQLKPKEKTPVILPKNQSKPGNITSYRAWYQLTRTFHCHNGEKMVEQVKITLNLLQPFRLSPKLSSYDQIFGAFS